MAKGLDDMAKKLKRLDKHLGEEIATQINQLLKDSVKTSLVDWYDDYTPVTYERTYNLMKIVNGSRASGKGNLISMYVDSGYMSNYLGWNGGTYNNTYSIPNKGKESYSNQRLNASIAFDFMFMNGEHGHGKWQKKISTPPYLYVDAEINSGFGGKVYDIIDKKIEEILRK